MNGIELIKEGLTQTFSNNPVIWGKWLLVFATIILTFIIRIKFNIDDIFNPYKKLDKKVKKAIEENHIINATLIKSYTDKDNNICSGYYEYEIDGKKHKYNALFNGTYARNILHLYYENNPKKVFTNEEQHYYSLKGLPLVILNFSPFIVGVIMVWILGIVK